MTRVSWVSLIKDFINVLEIPGAVQFFKWEQRMAEYIWIALRSSFFCATVQLDKRPGFFLLCSNRRTPTVFQGCYSLWERSESSLFPSSLPQQCVFPRSDPCWCWLPRSGSLSPFSTQTPLMASDFFLKSTKGPLVFAVFRNKLFFLHHTVRCSTSSL